MHEYVRAMASPTVETFTNKDGQKFSMFMICFNLKYPKYAWSHRGRKEILAGLLKEKAKMHYRTLPGRIRVGPFKGVTKSLKE